MSRIAKKPLELPDGVKAGVKDGAALFEGPKGKTQFALPRYVHFKTEGKKLLVERANDSKQARANQGTAYRLAVNAVAGVKDGYKRVLQIRGTGYSANFATGKLTLALGYSHPVDLAVPADLKIAVVKEKDIMTKEDLVNVTIEGTDKHKLGQFCSDIKSLRPIEPYNLKGIKYMEEIVKKKERKAALGAATKT